ncbi:alpha/beta fold hydrolase [Gymnodinialimonas mytili]|uniref:alpha/beta fold hydrolase n=1 Tax=Gymnodinialimonas mytili TaxID=3126503 RepID=UPI0030EDE928
MLHCTLAQGGAWAGMARHLLARLTMVAPDLLSHGTAPNADRSRDYHLQATQAAAAHLPQTPCHLIGHSFGATLALCIALDHPDAIKTLTLIEPVLFCAANGPGRAAHDAHVARLPGGYSGAAPEVIAKHFLALWGAEPFETLPQAHRDYMAARVWIPAATEPALIHDNANILPRLPELIAPTLLIEGAATHPVIGEINASLATDIPYARRHVIAEAAHMAPITHPRVTATAIATFLDTL